MSEEHCLFAGGLRNCLILHAFNEVPRTADQSTLLKRTLPTRNRFIHYTLHLSLIHLSAALLPVRELLLVVLTPVFVGSGVVTAMDIACAFIDRA